MQDMLKFKETLDAILEVSKAKNYTLTMDEVRKFFEDLALSDEQYGFVYDYLIMNKIKIENYDSKGVSIFQNAEAQSVPSDLEESDGRNIKKNLKREVHSKPERKSINLNKKEEEYINHYLHELNLIDPGNAVDKPLVLNKAFDGDENSKKELLNLYLKMVVDQVYEFCGRGTPAADLIQEGNVALMLAIEELIIRGDRGTVSDAESFFRKQILSAMGASINEVSSSKEQEQIMLLKVKQIHKAANDLAEENMRLATVKEISNYTRITEEEIQNILKLSKEDLGVTDGHTHK